MCGGGAGLELGVWGLAFGVRVGGLRLHMQAGGAVHGIYKSLYVLWSEH